MTSARDIDEADPGLARERTDLAWTRTAVSVAALGGAMLRIAPLAGTLVMALSFLIWTIGRFPRGSSTGRGAACRSLLVTVTITCTALAALILAYS